MVREVLTALVIVGVSGTLALGDTILSKGNYEVSLLEITGFQEGLVAYMSNSHRIRYKPLKNIVRLAMDRQRLLTRAEEQRGQKQYAMATELYRAVVDSDVPTWVKQLARYRLVEVSQQAGRIDQAVQAWLDILLVAPGDEALRLVPTMFAPRGDGLNAAAIEAANARLGSLKDKTVRRAVLLCLIDLCRHEGLTEKADAYARAVEAQTLLPVAERDQEARVPPVKKGTEFGPLFDAARQLLRPDQDPQVLADQVKTLEDSLNRVSAEDLGRALLLVGKGKLYLAQRESDVPTRRQMLLQAGLTLMRAKVAAQDPVVAAEALFLAGRVNELIGNRRAAEAAYRAVTVRYGSIREAAGQAAKALDELLANGSKAGQDGSGGAIRSSDKTSEGAPR